MVICRSLVLASGASRSGSVTPFRGDMGRLQRWLLLSFWSSWVLSCLAVGQVNVLTRRHVALYFVHARGDVWKIDE
ncbi:hypothetical protein EV126DRAFT_257274 [Verticillium dahliae]|nr:hypothetical protein EV126DRAFT_257274 [Verticillium dahliae]